MIGGMLGRINTAEKMSVEQLQQALQSESIPAYIGVPILEEKLNMRDRSLALAYGQQVATQPPIIEEIMQRAQSAPNVPAELQGVDQLPTQLRPEASMAQGGIVAFAKGGRVPPKNNPRTGKPYTALEKYMGLPEHDAAAQPPAGQYSEDVPGGQSGIRGAIADMFSGMRLPPEPNQTVEDVDHDGTGFGPAAVDGLSRLNQPREAPQYSEDVVRPSTPRVLPSGPRMMPPDPAQYSEDVVQMPHPDPRTSAGILEALSRLSTSDSGTPPQYSEDVVRPSTPRVLPSGPRMMPPDPAQYSEGDYGSDFSGAVAAARAAAGGGRELTDEEKAQQTERDRLGIRAPVSAAGDVFFGGPVNAGATALDWFRNSRAGRALGVEGETPRIGTGTATPFYDGYRTDKEQMDHRHGMGESGNAAFGPAEGKFSTAPTHGIGEDVYPGPEGLRGALQGAPQKATRGAPQKTTQIVPGAGTGLGAGAPPPPRVTGGPGAGAGIAALPSNLGSVGGGGIAGEGAPAAAAEPSALNRYIDMLMDERKGSAKEKENAKYNALLEAGLAIMAGKSPYALQNIGEGAKMGLQAYNESIRGIDRKDRDALEKAMAAEAMLEDTGLKREVFASDAEYKRAMVDIKKAELGIRAGGASGFKVKDYATTVTNIYKEIKGSSEGTTMPDEEAWRLASTRARAMYGIAEPEGMQRRPPGDAPQKPWWDFFNPSND